MEHLITISVNSRQAHGSSGGRGWGDADWTLGWIVDRAIRSTRWLVGRLVLAIVAKGWGDIERYREEEIPRQRQQSPLPRPRIYFTTKRENWWGGEVFRRRFAPRGGETGRVPRMSPAARSKLIEFPRVSNEPPPVIETYLLYAVLCNFFAFRLRIYVYIYFKREKE